MSVLIEANELINGDRQKAYGEPKENLQKIADQWNLYLFQRTGRLLELTAEDVCWMMADLKKVRQMNGASRDNVVDAAGYIGLVERVGSFE